MGEDESDRSTDRRLTIAIPTYKRPTSLSATLASIAERAETDSFTSVEVLVVDNDRDESGREVASTTTVPFPIRYVVEHTTGVSAVRNTALREARGEVLAFIDDDEVVVSGWPDLLFAEMDRSGAALVGGPVESVFEVEPAAWIRRTSFFERMRFPTGTRREWLAAGNLAIDLQKIREADIWFDEHFGKSGSEDTAFGLDVSAAGYEISWCAEAILQELVPPNRTTLKWMRERRRIGSAGHLRAQARTPNGRARVMRLTLNAAVRTLLAPFVIIGGVVSLRRDLMAKGVIWFSIAAGTIDGLRDYRPSAYGTDDRVVSSPGD